MFRSYINTVDNPKTIAIPSTTLRPWGALILLRPYRLAT